MNTPVKPTDQQKIAGAMSTVVLENTPLVIDNTPVTVLQDSPYIFIVTQNGTEIKVPLGINSTTDGCTIYRTSSTCQNGRPCILDSNNQPTCDCGTGYTGDYCQYVAKAVDTAEDDLVKIGVPILAAAAALTALTCVIFALRKANKNKEEEPSESSDGIPVFGMPSTMYLPTYTKAFTPFSSSSNWDGDDLSVDPLFDFPITYPYDSEELGQYPLPDDDISLDIPNDNISLDLDWFNDALTNEPDFNIPRPNLISTEPIFLNLNSEY